MFWDIFLLNTIIFSCKREFTYFFDQIEQIFHWVLRLMDYDMSFGQSLWHEDICNASWQRKEKRKGSKIWHAYLWGYKRTWITRRRRWRRHTPAFSILRARAKNSRVVTIWLTHPPFRRHPFLGLASWRLTSNFSYNQINLHPHCLSRKTIHIHRREYIRCSLYVCVRNIMKRFVYRRVLRYNIN